MINILSKTYRDYSDRNMITVIMNDISDILSANHRSPNNSNVWRSLAIWTDNQRQNHRNQLYNEDKVRIKTRNANSIVEYSLLLVVAIFAFVSMQAYLKRNVQGGMRRQIDQMAPQFSYEHGNTSERTIIQYKYNATLSEGDSDQNYNQHILRTTHEAIEGESAETKRIGF